MMRLAAHATTSRSEGLARKLAFESVTSPARKKAVRLKERQRSQAPRFTLDTELWTGSLRRRARRTTRPMLARDWKLALAMSSLGSCQEALPGTDWAAISVYVEVRALGPTLVEHAVWTCLTTTQTCLAQCVLPSRVLAT